MWASGQMPIIHDDTIAEEEERVKKLICLKRNHRMNRRPGKETRETIAD
jgi:hypothetical protein